MRAAACSRCGAAMLDLFTSQVCSASCDTLPKDVRVTRRHKMILSGGWILWTQDETPPVGWTHCRVQSTTDGGISDQGSGIPRPTVERMAKSTWAYWSQFAVAGSAHTLRITERGHEGFAYLVP